MSHVHDLMFSYMTDQIALPDYTECGASILREPADDIDLRHVGNSGCHSGNSKAKRWRGRGGCFRFRDVVAEDARTYRHIHSRKLVFFCEHVQPCYRFSACLSLSAIPRDYRAYKSTRCKGPKSLAPPHTAYWEVLI